MNRRIDDLESTETTLKLVLYFDVFHHPLTLSELERFVCPGEPERIQALCEGLVARGALEAEGPYCFVPGRQGGIARRRARATNAELRWPQARWAADQLAALPWIEGVLITGGLSKGSAEPDDDVDFLLLVTPGAVWTLKSFLQLARKALPPGLRNLFCTNYLLDTDHLEIDDKNLFTAVELATAVPMAGPEVCARLIEENAWATKHIPGLDWSWDRATKALPLGRPGTLRLIERHGAVPPRLERATRNLWSRYWNRKYSWLDDGVRAQRFKRREEIATNHLHDFQAYVLGEVEARFRRAGLATDDIAAPAAQTR